MEPYDDSCLPTNPTTENDYHGSFPYCSVHAQIFSYVSDCMIMRKKAPANEQEALRDVVWETRTINKKLHITPIHPNITSVLIVSKPGDEEVEEKVREVIDWLLSLENIVIFIQKSMESVFPKHERIQYWTTLLCTKHSQLFDLVLTLGGDGTVLYTSRLFQRTVPPIMPFAMGTLGFLTHFDINNYKSTIQEICKEMYIHLRTRFECRVMKKKDRTKFINLDNHLSQSLCESDTDTHEFTDSLVVLNEVVIDRGPNTAMSDLMLYVDSKYLTTVKADGLCVSTPTGSTAYSLAAGGSLCHPDISVMIVSPICAHSLSLRPIHVPDSMALHVVVPQDASQSSWISFDGRNRTELLQGDYLTVRISRYPFPTVHSSEEDADWFESIKRTLMWNQN
ncbi:NAD/NADH kinase [Schizosaccharomyces cryophilus OY26]|uniref:NAD/NADH kinase n=1 Tax=Schizosaccharomyces cryophilus (strain OY26 / ATCC MYA-4695 / CBS 11777 / NBRC 106824 / NRRL Y48691) TaxID=653667 RepID=S9VR74_SCHCR|nr:NAD/NADH kinase [Schizosaccharomyces cryophilus OY26]EPY50443.1 NAD/NADH kinase [Schizosaccharomyces cryophilus OY26]